MLTKLDVELHIAQLLVSLFYENNLDLSSENGMFFIFRRGELSSIYKRQNRYFDAYPAVLMRGLVSATCGQSTLSRLLVLR